MRSILFAATCIFLFSCNGSDKKDPNQAMDDTARMRNPPVQAPLFNRVLLMENEITSVIKVKGKVIEASKWMDSKGENFVILSSVGPFDDKGKNKDEEDGQTTELYIAHYTRDGNNYPKKWDRKATVQACPFDITAKFIPGSLTITDLDNDSIAEVKIQYLTACRSAVSPAAMNLVMEENGSAYELTGSSWIAYSPEFKFDVNEKNVNMESQPPLKDETQEMLRGFGRYENEKGFAGTPPGFLNFARKEWLKYVIEKMGE